MKKVLMVLMTLVIVAGFAFAAEPTPSAISNTTANTITLTSEVKEIIPVFKLFIGDASATATAPATYDTEKSIADEKITATFWIKQQGEKLNNADKNFARYGSKTAGTAVKITVSCGAFAYYGDPTTPNANPDLNSVSGAPSITAKAFAGTSTNNLLTFANTDISTGSVEATSSAPAATTVTFAPKYWGKKVTDRDIASFTAEWAAVETLPVGLYKADVTLSYTTN